MRPTHLLAALALLLPALLPAAPATADPLPADGCTNHGTRVLVGATMRCDSGTDCRNDGVVVNVGGRFDCVGGGCPNRGVLVNVGGVHCGDASDRACLGSLCIAAGDGAGGGEGAGPAALQAGPGGCPAVERASPTDWHLRCGAGDRACSISQDAACWAVRYLCMNVLVDAIRAYNRNVGGRSTCQGQPGWEGNFSGVETEAEPPDAMAPALQDAWRCAVSVGDCADGHCLVNVAASCDGTCALDLAATCAGTCAANVGATCSGSCAVNALSVCTGRCLVMAAGGCRIDRLPAATAPEPPRASRPPIPAVPPAV